MQAQELKQGMGTSWSKQRRQTHSTNSGCDARHPSITENVGAEDPLWVMCRLYQDASSKRDS